MTSCSVVAANVAEEPVFHVKGEHKLQWKMSRCRKGVCVMNRKIGKSEPEIGKRNWKCDRQSGTSISCFLNTHLSPIFIIPSMFGIHIHSSASSAIVLDDGAQILGVRLSRLTLHHLHP